MSVPLVSPSDAYNRLRASPSSVLIDVRTPAEFASVHATGARSLPLDALDVSKFAAPAREAATGQVFVICKSGGRSAKACQSLISSGVTDVFSVEGGTEAWQQAGLPVERGQRKVMSLERQVRIAAGSLVVLGIALALTVHPGFVGISLFVGCGLVFSGVTDTCTMGLLLAKLPWNR